MCYFQPTPGLIPSEWICADESISQWYGLGDQWINIDVPMYLVIDRKLESGCEIQSSAYGKSGVILQLKIVNYIETKDLHLVEGPDELPHGTSVLKYLVLPWAQTGRGVCADSYFVSVTTAQTLIGLSLRLIDDYQYFVSMASSLKEGKQDEDHINVPNNQEAVHQHLTVPQPEVFEI